MGGPKVHVVHTRVSEAARMAISSVRPSAVRLAGRWVCTSRADEDPGTKGQGRGNTSQKG